MKHTCSKFLIFLLFISIILILMSSCQAYRPSVSIFENITECNQIKNDACNTIQVSTFANYELDEYIKEMEPEKFFICEYTSTQLNFTLYAYTFKNNDDAQQYFYYVTGKRNNPTTTFSDSSGIIFRRIAVDGANVYRVVSKPSHADKTTAYINSVFTKKIW